MPKYSPKKLADEILKSILAPQAYNKGLVKNLDKTEQVTYEIPKGMTEDQAMLAVLGAMMDPKLMDQVNNFSSPGSSPDVTWKQIFLYRDLLTGDKRSNNYEEALYQGRKLAAEAFESFKNGDDSKVKEMMSRAANIIRESLLNINFNGAQKQNSAVAAMGILVRAQGNPSLDKAMNVSPEEVKRMNALQIHSEIYYEMSDAEEKLRKEYGTASPDRRKELLFEYGYRRLIHDEFKKESKRYNDYNYKEKMEEIHVNVQAKSERYIVSDPRYSEMLKKEYVEYAKTHPSDLYNMLNAQNGREKLVENAKKSFSESKILNSMSDKISFAQFETLFDKVNIKVSDNTRTEKERQNLIKQWNGTKGALNKEMRAKITEIFNYDKTVRDRIENIAEEKKAGNYIILSEETIKNGYNSLGDYVRLQRPVYILSEDKSTIYRIRSLDGEHFDIESMNQMPKGSRGKENASHMLINSLLDISKSLTDFEKVNLESLAKETKENKLENVFECYQKIKEDINTAYRDQGNTAYNTLKNDINKFLEITKGKENITSISSANASIKEAAATLEDYLRKMAAERRSYSGTEIAVSPEIASRVLDKHYEAEALKLQAQEIQRKQNGSNLPDAIGRETEAKKSIEGYIGLLNKLEVEIPQGLEEQYTAFRENLSQLAILTNKLYQKDEHGAYKPSSWSDYEKIMMGSLKTLDSVRKLKEVLPVDGTTALYDITGQIEGLLKKDVNTLVSTRFAEGKSLAEMIDAGRTIKVNTDGLEFDKVGAVSNVRKAMSVTLNGEQVKGFFTEEKRLTYGDKIEKALEPVREKYKKSKNAGPLFDDIVRYTKETENFVLDEGGIIDFVEKYGYSGASDIVDDISNAIISLANMNNQYENERGDAIKADKGTSITGRNTAMSKVASLLGVPDIVARSENMEISNGGKVIKGVFMANAKGIAYYDFTPEVIEKLNDNFIDNPQMIEDVVKLQMLDFICQNTDRHAQNMFYKLSEDGSSIVGVQGIDNDLSFGVAEYADNDKPGDNLSSLNEIQFIPQGMAERVQLMDKSVLSTVLHDCGLTENEINAAAGRLEKVKEAIADKRIRVVGDDEWANLHMSDFIPEKPDLKLKQMSFLQKNAVRFSSKEKLKNEVLENKINEIKKAIAKGEDSEEAWNKAKEQTKKQLEFKEVKVMDGADKISFEEDARKVDAFLDRLNRSQKSVWKSSTEFKDIVTAVKDMKQQLKNMPDDPTSQDYIKLQAKFENIGDKAKAYLDIKEGKTGLNAKTQQRMNLASEILQFSKTRGREYVDAMHRKDELEVERMNIEARKAITEPDVAEKASLDRAIRYAQISYTNKIGTESLELMKTTISANDIMRSIIGDKQGNMLEEVRPELPDVMARLAARELLLYEREQKNPGYEQRNETVLPNIGPVETTIEKMKAKEFINALAKSEQMKKFCEKVTVGDLQKMQKTGGYLRFGLDMMKAFDKTAEKINTAGNTKNKELERKVDQAGRIK